MEGYALFLPQAQARAIKRYALFCRRRKARDETLRKNVLLCALQGHYFHWISGG